MASSSISLNIYSTKSKRKLLKLRFAHQKKKKTRKKKAIDTNSFKEKSTGATMTAHVANGVHCRTIGTWSVY